MRRNGIAVSLGALALALAACSGCARNPQMQLDVNGVSRNYFLHVPDNLGAGAPVMLVFHGGGTNSETQGRNMGRFTGFNDLADREGFLAVYPSSLGGNWNDGRVGHGAEDVDDMAYMTALLDQLEADHDIDPSRIYATGISNGGFFSQRLACEMADRIAATYTVAATQPEETREACSPSRPISVAWAMGTEDPLVPYAGGPVAEDRGQAADMEVIRFELAERNGCADPIEEVWEDIDPDDGSTVTELIHGQCTADTEVRLLRIDGGGHTWPGGSQYLPASVIGETNRDFDATEDIWGFVSRFQLPAGS